MKEHLKISASRKIWVCRSFPRALIGALIIKLWAHGSISLPLFIMYLFTALILALLFCLLPTKQLDILLTESQLRAPVKSGLWFKSVTVDISEIEYSDTFIDNLRGSNISTHQGDVFCLSLLYYTKKDIKALKELIHKKSRWGDRGAV